MTTKITIDAHAGWPVRVVFVDPNNGRTEAPPRLVRPNAIYHCYIHDKRWVQIEEVQPEDHRPPPDDPNWVGAPASPGFDLASHLRRQQDFSLKTFGPGARTKGVIDHIRKELAEIEADPGDVMAWVDVIILAFDGAWRAGWDADAIVAAIEAKHAKNEARQWPDWRGADPDKAIEHVRAGEAAP